VAGVSIKVDIDDREVEELLSRLRERVEDLTPVMKIIGETVRTSVVRNFEKGGRPDAWQPLAPATLKGEKRGAGILRRRGFAGGLLGSINSKAYKDRAVVGTNKVYGAIHQFGGKAGRGHKVTIPARPFLMVQDEDWDEIKEALAGYIFGPA